jgi:hypothetical protein
MHEKCFTDDFFSFPKPRCDLECRSKQCELEPLKAPNDKRVLQATTAGPDILPADYLAPTPK